MNFLKNQRLMRTFALALSIVGFSVLPAMAQSQLKAVLEMFTSQGCSSCPPADKIVGEYAKRDDVLALAFHVDYWNYLGWKDTFSKREFSKRQQRYAASFHRRGVYTPQAVVNGRTHVVGSSGSEIHDLLTEFGRTGKGLSVPITATRQGGNIHVSTKADMGNATLWVVYYDKDQTVKIERGENRGKTIHYHNVVRKISILGMMENGKLEITLPLNEMRLEGSDACAIIAQETTSQGTPGPILGATIIADFKG